MGGAGAGCGWGPLVAQLGEAVFAKWAGQIGAKRVHLDGKPLRRYIVLPQCPNSERDSIMPCAVKTVLKPVYSSLSGDQSKGLSYLFFQKLAYTL